ncbi:hybrid sensor histidine kinase/response regulator [Geothermobacter hydrogeniphilus]|uniref:histidine kinase n=1 Tax=Geothermobacter hydrogeniphilus TaxID=1969733 RepID=A0A1X0Y673_9BACT|nr:response regulator [Geothermobacter hydrogeniphilus]ORJ60607.1 hypothetical protein B5V00_07155 [Geothermobacter hydrogeniphilus]
MGSSRTDSNRPYLLQSLFQITVLVCLLIFVGWSLFTMRQTEERRFRFEALNRCRVLEVAIADILHGGSKRQVDQIQKRIDKLVQSDPRIVRLSVIAKAADGRYRHIASSLPIRVGKPAREEDLEALSSGKIIFLDEDYRDVGALDITYPVRDFDGRTVALLGYTVSRETNDHTPLVLSGLGLLTFFLLLFHLLQARVLARQDRSIQQSLRRQLQDEESLRSMAEELHQAKKMEAIGLLAGGVAHDLNNMLMGIVALPDLLLEDDNLTPRQREQLADIRDAGRRIADVVADMQALSRNSAASREIVDLNRIIEEYLDSPEYQELCRHHGVDLSTELEFCLPAVIGTGSHLRKVVMNLIINAMEACDRQGQITVSTATHSLTEPHKGYETVPPGKYVRLRISDTGSGIDPDIMGQVFDPFFSKKGLGRSGTGLGLAVCWSIIHDHRGYIDLYTNQPGSVFDIYLPASVLETPLLTEQDAPLPRAQGNGASIMVLDDESGPRSVICDMLRSLGYQVLEAGSGEDALEILSRRKVDLLLLDMVMPSGLSGLETYRRVISLHPDQKTLIVSGQAETNDVREAQRLGAGLFLKKPLNLQQLATAIHTELHHPPDSAPHPDTSSS